MAPTSFETDHISESSVGAKASGSPISPATSALVKSASAKKPPRKTILCVGGQKHVRELLEPSLDFNPQICPRRPETPERKHERPWLALP
jgi:hypothetical protein